MRPEARVPLYLFIFYYYYFLAIPHRMWDLRSPTRIKPVLLAVEAESLNHKTDREV